MSWTPGGETRDAETFVGPCLCETAALQALAEQPWPIF